MNTRSGLPLIALLTISFFTHPLLAQATLPAQPTTSTVTFKHLGPSNSPKTTHLTVTVSSIPSSALPTRPLPFRAIIKQPSGKFADPTGLGLYADGRFFADSKFSINLLPGESKIAIAAGPNFIPITFTAKLTAGKKTLANVQLLQWFSPESRGWYSGDNHVHAQHDRHAAVKTSNAYTALQARANGLSYITEAGSKLTPKDIHKLDRPDFLFRYAPELRPGPFVGHVNTPGLNKSFTYAEQRAFETGPLPVQRIINAANKRNGVVIHTHPMTPRHILHWMGAGEFYSDAVIGRTAHAFDTDQRATDELYFAALNLGAKVAVSSYTDAALGRTRTLSPGDRRVYSYATRFNYKSIISAIRTGRTFATNGGPIFAFLNVNAKTPGHTVTQSNPAEPITANVEVHSLLPLRSVELYQRGVRIKTFNVQNKKGKFTATFPIKIHPTLPDWILLRAENTSGKWAITSPVYLKPASSLTAPSPLKSAVILEISNHTRFIHLRKQFFAHLIATINPDYQIAHIDLIKDNQTLKRFSMLNGNHIQNNLTPVTHLRGDYAPGWLFHPSKKPYHFQADFPISKTGWYALRITTTTGKTIRSDEIHFNAKNPNSHAVSFAQLTGPQTSFRIHGYGEEMKITNIKFPFKGDHWWYPKNTYYQIQTRFHSQRRALGPTNPKHAARFRRAAFPSKIIAHRGFSAIAPENTLAAIKAAVKAGSEFCEFDVYASKDSHIILMHDKTLKRTTNGKGKTTSATLAYLQSLDAGSWKSKKYAGEKIPTLAQTLAYLKTTVTVPVIEIKQAGIAAKVARDIHKAKLNNKVVVISFVANELKTIHNLDPSIKTAFLYGEKLKGKTWDQAQFLTNLARRANTRTLNLKHNLLTPPLIRELKSRGYNIWTYTVNDQPTMQKLMRLGITHITTDRPDLLKKSRDLLTR